MKRTSEELLEFLGIKVGDVLKIDCDNVFRNQSYTVIQNPEKPSDIRLLGNETVHRFFLELILDSDYEIIRTPQLTDDEKVILRNLPKEFKWIVRDETGFIWLATDKPQRINRGWRETKSCELDLLGVLDHLFQSIKWEDEPYLIEELVK